ncbi:hypothetical protein COW94_03390 [Candidatus Peregrinibacteria bacterium CG22_combo_CG10-13_8_21_14_all_44_10]|nr:MAG: hypothetical protein AUK45_04850 [Candidatus Peregrinibacteria bacterium CG2_30_44_17]PIP66104.1 MAG: hypothetical protein COW94_03390 [Candidatus Peregrinibacteria bacterium CG22_combo_CG10-13_8_21_14_all_44_10]
MNPKDLMYTQRRFTFLHLISFVVFFAVLFYGAYTFISKSSLESSASDTDSQISNLEEQIVELEKQSLGAVTVAQQLIAQVEESEIEWSNVISRLLDATPLDIYYSSYSGSEDGVVTVTGMADTYHSVAGLVTALNAGSYFGDVFVSSVATATITDTEAVSFNLMFGYDDVKVSR